MATKIYSVRFDPDLMARVDAHDLGRSEFIRGAVEAALNDPPAVPMTDDEVKAYCAEVTKPDARFSDLPMKPAPAGSHRYVPLKKNSIVPPAGEPVAGPGLSAAPSGRQADAAAVLGVIRSKRLTSRQAEAAMGWLGLRYSNAEKLLLSSGAAAVVDGNLVAT